MGENLMIGLLGKAKSGKTYTWNLLFRKPNVRTGKKMRRLYFDEKQYVDVFLISRSAQKRKMDVKSIVKDKEPRIILCSMQYAKKLPETLSYFVDKQYFMVIHWLNPGYNEPNDIPLFYDSDLIDYILSVPSMIGVRNGKGDAEPRVEELRNFIYAWANGQGLIKTR